MRIITFLTLLTLFISFNYGQTEDELVTFLARASQTDSLSKKLAVKENEESIPEFNYLCSDRTKTLVLNELASAPIDYDFNELSLHLTPTFIDLNSGVPYGKVYIDSYKKQEAVIAIVLAGPKKENEAETWSYAKYTFGLVKKRWSLTGVEYFNETYQKQYE